MIKMVDRSIGELTSKLQANNLTEKVNIIVISDHGKKFLYCYSVVKLKIYH